VSSSSCGAGSWQEIPGKGGGSKPYPFVRWMLELLDFQEGDELVDLFPGSGGVARHASLEMPELFDVLTAQSDGRDET
jgi:hypothetical protein